LRDQEGDFKQSGCAGIQQPRKAGQGRQKSWKTDASAARNFEHKTLACKDIRQKTGMRAAVKNIAISFVLLELFHKLHFLP
jgi:hypothetical protein